MVDGSRAALSVQQCDEDTYQTCRLRRPCVPFNSDVVTDARQSQRPLSTGAGYFLCLLLGGARRVSARVRPRKWEVEVYDQRAVVEVASVQGTGREMSQLITAGLSSPFRRKSLPNTTQQVLR